MSMSNSIFKKFNYGNDGKVSGYGISCPAIMGGNFQGRNFESRHVNINGIGASMRAILKNTTYTIM